MERHKPVLVEEVFSFVPEKAKILVDGTLGHGGHTQYILENIEHNSIEKIYGIDVDSKVLGRARENLFGYEKKLVFTNDSYSNIDKILNPNSVDFILLDLGVNMEHFKDFDRGFSIKENSYLDMTFDGSKNTAANFINTASTDTIASMLHDFGDFSYKFSQAIADTIIQKRKIKPINTTFELIDILKEFRFGQKKIAVVFQCIRIKVNLELEKLKTFLDKLPYILSKGGVCAIITYHSIEDRIVKFAFKDYSKNGFQLINKKVIKPSWEEISNNKAARSAKLRGIKLL
ncbi:16S rRNA (cytosine(1402)-N(4))-methyltransferase RsmH [Candidatus Absconditicoccus praedator]|uniref:16S rRNA (cytosine(1402)-N(4))-methyltransferase RsmH n=1 Tax=Candidatus Absconditicoccus praedator TaxID=2735562 RepID=UPI001E44719F|nr:16S rRNA (cytosine(1402)-N(4))-methyltransferase RsmH [Candidatus Absconditicoccus praedator]UFX83110.1 16S rRNA (cytosine(1402)-N(4))-methyltransferase RsmH [Candidatus Absconditicoccus praedator]